MIESEPVSRRSIVGLAIAFEGGLGLIALGVGWFLARPPHEQIAWSATAVGQGLLAAVPLLAGAWLMTRWPVRPLGPLDALVRRYVVPLFHECSTFDLLLISAAAGIGEELLFRGVVQTGVEQLTGSVALAILVGGIAFGLAHAMTTTYAVLAGLIGAYLGWLQVATGNLLVPIVTHGAYDFCALVYLLRQNPSSNEVRDVTSGDDPPDGDG